jgi:hypothetical protein
MPQETYEDAISFSPESQEKCLYNGIIREAIASIMVIGPDLILKKIFAWIKSESIWTENIILNKKEAQQVTQIILEWFSQKAS